MAVYLKMISFSLQRSYTMNAQFILLRSVNINKTEFLNVRGLRERSYILAKCPHHEGQIGCLQIDILKKEDRS